MRFGDPLHNRQPEPESAIVPRTGLIRAKEPLKNVRRGFRREFRCRYPEIAQQNSICAAFELGLPTRPPDGV